MAVVYRLVSLCLSGRIEWLEEQKKRFRKRGELRRRLRQALTVVWAVGFLVLWLGQCLMNAVMDRLLYSGVWRPWPIRLTVGGMALIVLLGLVRWIWVRLSGG